jgi:hypothetical protein
MSENLNLAIKEKGNGGAVAVTNKGRRQNVTVLPLTAPVMPTFYRISSARELDTGSHLL